MVTKEDKIKEFVINEVFSEYPIIDNAYDVFIDGSGDLSGFVLCEQYGLNSLQEIRDYMKQQYSSLLNLFQSILAIKSDDELDEKEIVVTLYWNRCGAKELEEHHAMIGQQGVGFYEDAFYWFEDESKVIGDHGEFTVVAFKDVA